MNITIYVADIREPKTWCHVFSANRLPEVGESICIGDDAFRPIEAIGWFQKDSLDEFIYPVIFVDFEKEQKL